ncbi:peptidoglycan-associated lipoprotein Pal [Eilatimonas milleporae]|uniref:Peptidoglycan-associated lipoprotein n=1 Tax=Eilatimonas milleporae TaxID=911205 RepID=A0A3M0CQP0_9PROT|nr:peptidoglycan-associated lipoprotein Pal [Eilatimonas milleporae]RMB11864.1 peptidoglycan-associated lipoprotein [Eilatimonas milleporae]
MTSKRLGSKFAFITIATLLLAACSQTPEPETETVDTEIDQGETESGRPDSVDQDQVIQDQVDPYGTADQESLTAYAGDRIFFDYDSSELTARSRDVLRKQADWLNHFPRQRVTIEGHCDERGTREYNLALGERRANAVKNYLVALGVPSSRLGTISYGKERPAVVGNSEQYWRQNRRGVLVVE